MRGINRTPHWWAKETKVPEHVYKTIEITGSSATGTDDAIRNAIARASKTIRDMRWFQVVETRGEIHDGNIPRWQITMKIGFTLEE